MSILAVVIKKLLSFVHCVLGTFKRLLCFLGRKRDDDGALPFTIQQAASSDAASASEFEGWENWGDSRKRQKTESEQKIEAYRHRLSTAREEIERAAVVAAEEEKKEVNYFESLQPELKPVKKIVLKPKYSGGSSSDAPLSPQNRFAVQSDINVFMSNVDTTSLGDLDESSRPTVGGGIGDAYSPWEVDDDSLNVDGVLKEAKHKELQHRLEEQRKKKLEKQRLSSKHALEAVKLS